MVNFGPNSFNNNLPQTYRQPLPQPSALEQVLTLRSQAMFEGMSIYASTTGLGCCNAVMANFLSASLSPQETALFLKNLLNLPRDIQGLLLLLAFPPGPERPETLKKLLEKYPDLNVTLENVQSFLGDHSKDGVQKLLKLIQGNQAAQLGDSKMEELLKLTSQLTNKVQASPMEALNTMMLLYLPWLPLVPPQKLETAFVPSEEEGGGAGNPDEKSYNLVLYIETNRLGKFQVSLHQSNHTQITLHVVHDAEAQSHLTALEAALAEKTGEDGIPKPEFIYEPRSAPASLPVAPSVAEAGAEMANPVERGKKIAVFPADGVSIIVVTVAYSYARLVFETDDRLNLASIRSEKLT